MPPGRPRAPLAAPAGRGAPTRRTTAAAAALAALVAAAGPLAGCERGAGDVGPPPGEADADAAPPAPDAAAGPTGGRLAAARVARWPDGAREITLRVEQAPATIDPATIRLRDVEGAELPSTAAPIALPPGYLAVLVAPAAAPARAAQAEALRALVASRPAGERIAVFAWQAAVDPITGFTDDPGRLERAAARVATLEEVAAPAAVESALLTAEAEVREVGGVHRPVMRAVLVLGHEVDPARSSVTAVVGAASTAAGALTAAAAIDALAAGAHLRVGVCADLDESSAILTVDGVDAELVVGLPATLPEERAGTCDPGVVQAPRALPAVIDFRFTPAERAIYDDRIATNDKASFALSVALDDRPAITASAHLRGQSSLGCARKSHTLTLDGPGRFLFADSSVDEVVLISMCLDDHYSQQYTADHLLAGRGLFPFAHRLVELRIDGASRGVYLMIERSDDDLRREDARPISVLRRTIGALPDDGLEVAWTRLSDDDAAIASWETFQASLAGLTGPALAAAVEAQLDLDAYLHALALASALENGDYIDEMFLTSTDALGAGSGLVPYFRPAAWDPDDLFSLCHLDGVYALVDPHGLAYCAEAELDRLLLADPAIYARFVERLERVLAELDDASFATAVARTEADLVPWFASAEVCAASVELLSTSPEATDPAVAQDAIRAYLATMRTRYRDRRLLLLDRIAAYHAAR